MKELEIYYHAESDCLHVRVPHAITAQQLAVVAKAGHDIDVARASSAVGDKRDILTKRVSAYRAGRVRQMVAKTGDAELFKATQGTGKIITMGI